MHKGHCLCGQVQITLNETFTSQLVCHCVSCQRWSGGPFLTVVLARKDQCRIEGEVKGYEYRGFNNDDVIRYHCPTCGSCISHTTSFMDQGNIAIQTGNFDDFASIPFEKEYNLQMKWKHLPPIPGAEQVNAGTGQR